MASTYTTSLKIQEIGSGEQSGYWGTTTNTNWTLIEQAVAGVQSIVMINADYTMTNLNGVSDEARNAVLVVTGTNSAIRKVVAPLNQPKTYIVSNQTTGGYAITIGASTGSYVTIPNGVTAQVYTDGTNFYSSQTGSAGDFTVNGTLTASGVADVGNLSVGGSATFTNSPTAPTPSPGDNTTKLATTAFVQNIAGGLGTMATQNANNVNISGGAINGVTGTNSGMTVGTATNATNLTSGGTIASNVTATTQAPGTNNTTVATTAFVQAATGTLGTMASQNANNVNITGGSITGLGTFSTSADATINSITVGRGGTANDFRSTAVGNLALSSLAGSGTYQNTAIGANALGSMTAGYDNTAVGASSMSQGTNMGFNTAAGYFSGAYLKNSSAQYNTAVGYIALQGDVSLGATGAYNTAIGSYALGLISTGYNNTAVGSQALNSMTGGSYNVAVGNGSLAHNVLGQYNVAIGVNAGGQSIGGADNVIIGNNALLYMTNRNYNTVIGSMAFYNSDGSNNIGIGYGAGLAGYNPLVSMTTQSNYILIGNTLNTNAYVNVAWTVVSDARDKTNISSVPHGLEFVNKLNPISYQFKTSREDETPHGPVRYGFKAQDVLELEGDSPVIVDNSELDKLKVTDTYMIPVLVKAIQELTARVKELEAK